MVINKDIPVDFYITNLNQNNWFKDATGWVKSGETKFTIRLVEKLSNNRRSLDTQVYGFEFLENARVVGAVETVNQGRVWLHRDIDANHKLVLA